MKISECLVIENNVLYFQSPDGLSTPLVNYNTPKKLTFYKFTQIVDSLDQENTRLLREALYETSPVEVDEVFGKLYETMELKLFLDNLINYGNSPDSSEVKQKKVIEAIKQIQKTDEIEKIDENKHPKVYTMSNSKYWMDVILLALSSENKDDIKSQFAVLLKNTTYENLFKSVEKELDIQKLKTLRRVNTFLKENVEGYAMRLDGVEEMFLIISVTLGIDQAYDYMKQQKDYKDDLTEIQHFCAKLIRYGGDDLQLGNLVSVCLKQNKNFLSSNIIMPDILEAVRSNDFEYIKTLLSFKLKDSKLEKTLKIGIFANIDVKRTLLESMYNNLATASNFIVRLTNELGEEIFDNKKSIDDISKKLVTDILVYDSVAAAVKELRQDPNKKVNVVKGRQEMIEKCISNILQEIPEDNDYKLANLNCNELSKQIVKDQLLTMSFLSFNNILNSVLHFFKNVYHRDLKNAFTKSYKEFYIDQKVNAAIRTANVGPESEPAN